jgi:hypothetical protein
MPQAQLVSYDITLDKFRCLAHPNKDFNTRSALDQHIGAIHANTYCFRCGRDFASSDARQQHRRNSTDHHLCVICEQDFDDNDKLQEHYKEEHYECDECDTVFDTHEGYQEHAADEHHYCKECDRFFTKESGLRAHLNSSVHASENLGCPMEECKQACASLSALILHWEAGGACAGTDVNEYRVDKWMRVYDVHRVLHNGRGGDEMRYNCCSDDCERSFRTLGGLMQHIESGVCNAAEDDFVKELTSNILGHFRYYVTR